MSEKNVRELPDRLVSLDAYRGFAMFLIMAELLHIGRVAGHFPESGLWKFLDYHTSHVAWIGCSLHDMIQPSFSFMVGVALAFSVANRASKGQGVGWMTGHALWRAVALVFLGIFLRSMGRSQTNFTFEDTLTQIGLGYFFLYLLAFRPMRELWVTFGVLVGGYWLAFALHPLPGPDFDYAAVGVATDWPHLMEGFAAHWNKNSNLAWQFDTWFMNLFPRESVFNYNGGGYSTLSFIPTLGTMILGLLAGKVLRDESEASKKMKTFLIWGAGGIVAGILLNVTGICPLVKRIWTPSFTLYSGGMCFLILLAFYFIIDVMGQKWWAFPLVVIGMNSIFIYCVVHMWDGFIESSFKTHFGQDVFAMFGEAWEPLVEGAAVMLVFWLILFWLYRRRVFIRI